MKKNQKKVLGLSNGLLIALVVVVLGVVGWYGSMHGSPIGIPGADIEIISGAGGMPPGQFPGELLKGEQFTVVFTEPFSSLENWEASKPVKEVGTSTGKARINIPSGKYGVYSIYKGQKTLYSQLDLENPRNDIPRNVQGPWYIKIKNLQRTRLNFSVNSLAE